MTRTPHYRGPVLKCWSEKLCAIRGLLGVACDNDYVRYGQEQGADTDGDDQNPGSREQHCNPVEESVLKVIVHDGPVQARFFVLFCLWKVSERRWPSSCSKKRGSTDLPENGIACCALGRLANT